MKEGGNIIPKKGARIIWTNDNKFLLVTGFTRESQRLLILYTSQDLKQVASTTLDVSPAILVPFYDEVSLRTYMTCRMPDGKLVLADKHECFSSERNFQKIRVHFS